MSWNFIGRVRSKKVLPRNEAYYGIKVTKHRQTHPTSQLITDAEYSLEICSHEMALRHLANQMVRVDDVFENHPRHFVWLTYWNDQNHISAMLTTDEDAMSLIAHDLDAALHSDELLVSFSASGGFSQISPNPYSMQPTVDEFEGGRILPLSDWSFSINRYEETVK